jgi:hypothetical protein
MNDQRYPRTSQEAFGSRAYAEDFDDLDPDTLRLYTGRWIMAILVALGILLWLA